MNENEYSGLQEPSTGEELVNAGRKVASTVSGAADLARGINKFSKQRKERQAEKEPGKEEQKDKEPGKEEQKDKETKENKGESDKNSPNKDNFPSNKNEIPKPKIDNASPSKISPKTPTPKENGASKVAGENVKKGGQAIAKAVGNGLKSLWKLIPPPYNWIVLGGIIIIILLLFIIFIIVGADEQDGKIYYTCSSIIIDVADENDNLTRKEISLEEYVVGICSHESSDYVTENSDGSYTIEALKAQAVAARTYALAITNNCTKLAPASNSAILGYKEQYAELAIQAAEETAGEVIVYNDKIFATEWDAFYGNRCEDGYCYATYTKEPNNEQHEIKVEEKLLPINGKYYYGHGRGLSQFGAYSMEKQGYSYDEILYTFYSDGIQIVKNGEGGVNDVLEFAHSYDFKGNYYGQWSNETKRLEGTSLNKLLGSSGIEELNLYIASQVSSVEDYGEKAVSAAMALASFLYQEGYRLPYLWGGKYYNNGVSSNWGASGYKNCSDTRCYYYGGLDCSGLVSWALYNVGCPSEITPFSSYVYQHPHLSKISDARPGDLLMCYGQKCGHVIMVVEYDDNLQMIRTIESAGGSNGLVFRAYGQSKLEQYYLLDMGNFYSTRCGG